MLWTDDTYNRIWKAKLDGTRATVIISTRLSCPGLVKTMFNQFYSLIDGIAWDWINEKLYWTDTCTRLLLKTMFD